MSEKTVLALSVLLAATPAVYSEDTLPELYGGAAQEPLENPWRQIKTNMSHEDYREVSRHNQRVAGDTFKGTFVSLGMSDTGSAMMGAAMGAAISEAEVNLNESKTMALQVKDAAESDRSVLLRFKLNWR